jgi:leucyl aminopeptidase
MGGILAVGGGSKNPPRLVRLTGEARQRLRSPPGAPAPRVALVGKG